MKHSWVRPEKGRLFSGVCAALSQQTGVPVLFLRALFVLLALPGGLGLYLYILLALLLPQEQTRQSS